MNLVLIRLSVLYHLLLVNLRDNVNGVKQYLLYLL